uniref:Uncharacterized protein n=1 Tax=Paulinella micropora TaxID=1928728 RepID=A0A385I1L7_9EUKA|nr:hypothetical protein PMNZ_860 [Paulinella micropora]AXY63775.1 hypothetical protein PMNZ_860 [Paulinella micropora]
MKTERKTIKDKATTLLNFVSIINIIPLTLLGLDLFTKEIFHTLKPQIELELVRQLKSPLKIGVYRGLGAGGISIGSSLIGPNYRTHSTAALQRIELSIVPFTSIYRKRIVLKVRCRKTELFLHRNVIGDYFYIPNPIIRNILPFYFDIDLTFHEPVIIKVYPSHLVTYLNLKAQICIAEKQMKIQGAVNFLKKGNIKLLYQGSVDNPNFEGRIILENLNLSIASKIIRNPQFHELYGELFGDIYCYWKQQKITCLGSVNFNNSQILLISSNHRIAKQLFQILCEGSTLKINGLRWNSPRWNIDMRGRIHLYG